MVWFFHDENEFSAVSEIFAENQSDRSVGIVAAAMIEDVLTAAIESRLRSMSKAMRERLFGDHGAIADFTIKTDLAFSLGLFGPITHDDLTAIRKVRNLFAHKKELSHFTQNAIKKFCSPLKLPNLGLESPWAEKSGDSPRDRYLDTVRIILWFLDSEMTQNKQIPPAPQHLP